jgi:hypothetical protein
MPAHHWAREVLAVRVFDLENRDPAGRLIVSGAR